MSVCFGLAQYFVMGKGSASGNTGHCVLPRGGVVLFSDDISPCGCLFLRPGLVAPLHDDHIQPLEFWTDPFLVKFHSTRSNKPTIHLTSYPFRRGCIGRVCHISPHDVNGYTHLSSPKVLSRRDSTHLPAHLGPSGFYISNPSPRNWKKKRRGKPAPRAGTGEGVKRKRE